MTIKLRNAIKDTRQAAYFIMRCSAIIGKLLRNIQTITEKKTEKKRKKDQKFTWKITNKLIHVPIKRPINDLSYSTWDHFIFRHKKREFDKFHF